MNNINVDRANFRLARWYEYAIRFGLGGLATVVTGVLAKEFGPQIGGLFLALPAILPASVTLIQTHETKKKRRSGLSGALRGKEAAAADAAGASIGSFGMLAFAILAWRLLPRWPVWVAFAGATASWFGVAVAIWRERKLGVRLIRR
jgi:Protein of unknown function (DUF3147)